MICWRHGRDTQPFGSQPFRSSCIRIDGQQASDNEQQMNELDMSGIWGQINCFLFGFGYRVERPHDLEFGDCTRIEKKLLEFASERSFQMELRPRHWRLALDSVQTWDWFHEINHNESGEKIEMTRGETRPFDIDMVIEDWIILEMKTGWTLCSMLSVTWTRLSSNELGLWSIMSCW